MYLNFDSKVGKLSKSSKTSEEAICGSSGRKNDMPRVDDGENFENDTELTSFNGSSGSRTLDRRVTDLHRQIAELSRTINDLKSGIRTKDTNLENIRRDNERLASELKKQQRCNRNLKRKLIECRERREEKKKKKKRQIIENDDKIMRDFILEQLDDERFFYQREKEHFCEEMRTRGTECQCAVTKGRGNSRREFEKLRESLESENEILKEKILDKSRVTYNLCIKFLRMKDSRDSFRQKLDRLLREHLRVMAEMMEKLDEAREELNIIVSEKFQEPLPISKAKFLQVVQRNSRLVYENASLKFHVQQLTQNIERLKAEAHKTKTINVDARTIEKLAECSRRRQSEETKKMFASASCSTNTDKSLSISKFSSPSNSPTVGRSGDTRVVSSIRSKNRGKLTIDNREDSPDGASVNFHAERIRSAPEIVQSSTFRQAQFFETPTNFTDISERSGEFRDFGTNT